jgi:glycerol-1-phosphatase
LTADSDSPVILCDLDGVVWLAGEALPGAPEALAELRRRGHRVGFLTNNSSLGIGEYVSRLERIGVPAGPDDVLTSSLAAADLLAGGLAPGARVLCCAGPGVAEALAAAGLEAVEEWPCEAVVVGWHRTFDFDRLDRASAAVRRGARFVATNLDPTYPAPDGLLPGNGALVAAVATASGKTPEVAGKPEAPTVALVRRRFGDRGVVVGDRASTDGALAAALDWPFALVVSEATRSPGEPDLDPPPRFTVPSLAALTEALALSPTPDTAAEAADGGG